MTMTHHLSRAAHDRLAAELEQLTTVGRIEIAQKIEEARALGDLSENGDYHAAKDHQGHMEGRIRQLQAILSNAIIVEGGDGDIVSVGTIVTIVYEGDTEDDAERYLIGHLEERHPDLDVISPGSPLGEALLGKRPGDEVSYQAPNGMLTVTVVDVEVA